MKTDVKLGRSKRNWDGMEYVEVKGPVDRCEKGGSKRSWICEGNKEGVTEPKTIVRMPWRTDGSSTMI